jgi:hypothetical protein
MYEFDKRLCALAGCPVIRDKSGAMAFNPYCTIGTMSLYMANILGFCTVNLLNYTKP